jgi:alpha-L-rhamnosidase
MVLSHRLRPGQPLASRDRAVWRVRVWDGGGKASDWSEPARFAIGLLEPLTRLDGPCGSAWRTTTPSPPPKTCQNFVGDPRRGTLHLTPAKYFRKEFETPAVTRATVHATALGCLHLEINGRRVSPNASRPVGPPISGASTRRTYDVTELVRKANAIGGILADGWYSGYVAYGLLTLQEGLVPGIDGRYYYGVSRRPCASSSNSNTPTARARPSHTDPTWKTSLGPITESTS